MNWVVCWMSWLQPFPLFWKAAYLVGHEEVKTQKSPGYILRKGQQPTDRKSNPSLFFSSSNGLILQPHNYRLFALTDKRCKCWYFIASCKEMATKQVGKKPSSWLHMKKSVVLDCFCWRIWLFMTIATKITFSVLTILVYKAIIFLSKICFGWKSIHKTDADN